MQLPECMQAMVMEQCRKPLLLKSVPMPVPAAGQVLIKVIACGICRTDLHIIDGELDKPNLPLIPGHEIVGMVMRTGHAISKYKEGDMVGVPWLGYTCGTCKYCQKGQENLCSNARFTGYTINGGYAEYTVANEHYCFPLPPRYANAAGAPLLCAGLIGYRAYTMISRDAVNIGIYGFGAAAHILIQVALFQGKKVYAFTRAGDKESQAFARQLGAEWAGDASAKAPELLDAAIIFAPVGELVVKALSDSDKGAQVICGGIHMSDIPCFPYHLLWNERSLRSVANLVRKDGIDFFALAPQIPIKTQVTVYKMQQANEAINDLRQGRLQGAAVLEIT